MIKFFKEMTIKKLLLLLLIPVIFLFWLSCFTMISPGYVGVIVDLLGEKKGVEAKELHVGMHWVAPWKSVYQFPIFEQNQTWEGENDTFNFQTSEGMAVSADVGITYHIRPESVPMIFQRYRRGMDEITNTFIRNYVRDAINKSASHIRIEDLYSSAKEVFFREVESSVRQELSPVGIEISRIYLIGRFHFPQTVITSLNSKIEATQRAEQRENELREAEAEAKKKIAQAEGQAKCFLLQADADARRSLLLAEAAAKSALVQAEAEAKANLVLAQSITKPLMQWQTIQKWNGKLPQVTAGENMIIPFGDKLNIQ